MAIVRTNLGKRICGTLESRHPELRNLNMAEDKMSKTPRTDAAAIGFARLLVDRDKFQVTELIPSDFARQLELEVQENAEAKAALDWLIKDGYFAAQGRQFFMVVNVISKDTLPYLKRLLERKDKP